MEAVVLAGGLGTRLRSVVPDLPKPMAPVWGRPFLAWLLDYWIGQGIVRFVLSVGYRQDAVRDYFSNSYRGVPIAYAAEREPLGTGGALLFAASMLERPGAFMALNGDTFFEVQLDKLTQFHSSRQAQWTLALFKIDGEDRYDSVSIDPDGRILAFGGGVGGLRNGGAYVIEPASLARLGNHEGRPCSLEMELLPSLLRDGAALYGMVSGARFLDIGIGPDYARAGEFLTTGQD
jgi:D-glycero-alpha-D-manno-heptose 1-phosphate guanylyltransferase